MNTRRATMALTAVACAGLLASACGSSDDDATSGDGVTVLASFYPLAFAAEQVGGDAVTVENLTQPGAESHDLELTGQQVGQVADADAVVYLRGFQPSVDAAVDQNAEDHAIDVGELAGVGAHGEHDESEHDEPEHESEHDEPGHEDEPEGESHDDTHDDTHEGHDHGDLDEDPHIWLDPANMEAIAEAVAERLAEVDPDNADTYQANAEALAGELHALDEEFATGLAQCERNLIVVAHEAFGYLADRYGLRQVGISGLDPEAEPSPERIAEVHDVVESEGVTTIFYERLVSPDVAETLADDLGVEAAVLDPIEGLTDDTADQNYLDLMRANLEALRAANGCT